MQIRKRYHLNPTINETVPALEGSVIKSYKSLCPLEQCLQLDFGLCLLLWGFFVSEDVFLMNDSCNIADGKILLDLTKL